MFDGTVAADGHDLRELILEARELGTTLTTPKCPELGIADNEDCSACWQSKLNNWRDKRPSLELGTLQIVCSFYEQHKADINEALNIPPHTKLVYNANEKDEENPSDCYYVCGSKVHLPAWKIIRAITTRYNIWMADLKRGDSKGSLHHGNFAAAAQALRKEFPDITAEQVRYALQHYLKDPKDIDQWIKHLEDAPQTVIGGGGEEYVRIQSKDIPLWEIIRSIKQSFGAWLSDLKEGSIKYHDSGDHKGITSDLANEFPHLTADAIKLALDHYLKDPKNIDKRIQEETGATEA